MILILGRVELFSSNTLVLYSWSEGDSPLRCFRLAFRVLNFLRRAVQVFELKLSIEHASGRTTLLNATAYEFHADRHDRCT